MGRKNLGEENVRKIQKSKRSYYVTLPIAYVRDLGWDEDRDVVVQKSAHGLVIENERRNGKGTSSDFKFAFRVRAKRKKN